MFFRLLTAFVVTGVMTAPAVARDYISLAGSSTVFPFATIVAEKFGQKPGLKTPVVESGGSSVGKKSVCDGIGTQFVDIGNASSRMKASELKYCDKNGVALTEIKIGYDGIVLANSKKAPVLKISLADLGKALTAEVPDASGKKWIPNPYKKWSELNPNYPDSAIRVYGPPTTSGTRASFAEMVNEKGYCGKDKVAKALSVERGDAKGKKCRAMRTDGAYIEAGEQDNLIVQKISQDKTSFGIFGYSYLDQNTDTIQGSELDGVAPTFDAIRSGKYVASRGLYFYVKHAHIGVIPGIKQYMAEWTKHWGADGVLADAGMIPMGKAERKEMMDRMNNLSVLKKDALK